MKKSRRPFLARQGQFAKRFMIGAHPPLDPVGLTGLTTSEWVGLQRALRERDRQDKILSAQRGND